MDSSDTSDFDEQVRQKGQDQEAQGSAIVDPNLHQPIEGPAAAPKKRMSKSERKRRKAEFKAK